MKEFHAPLITDDIEASLTQWRHRILDHIVTFGCIVGLPAIGFILYDLSRNWNNWLVVGIVVSYGFLVALGLARKMDQRLRSCGVLFIFYVIGIIGFARGGLAGSGRIFMLTLPVIALILLSVRAGILMTVLSILTTVAFAILAQVGALQGWLIYQENPLTLYSWAAEGTYTIVLLIAVMALLILFHRFQVKTLESEHRNANELKHTRELLEEQNRTLEARVEQRTAELGQAMQQAQASRTSIEQANREKDDMISGFRAVLDAIDFGVLLMGPDLRTLIGNRALCDMWKLPAELVMHGATMADLLNYNRDSGLYTVPRDEWDAYVKQREAAVSAGSIPPTQFRRGDGRIFKFQGMILPGGGRMLTYYDITDLVRQNEYLAALHDTTLGLVSHLNIQDLLHTLVSRAGQLLDTPDGFVYVLEPSSACIECQVGVGGLDSSVGLRLKKGEGLSGKVWETGEPIVINDYDAWAGRTNQFHKSQIRAIVGVPLRSNNQFVGVLGVARSVSSNQSFSADEVELLNRFAQLASVALGNAREYQQVQQEKQYLESLLLNSPTAIAVFDLHSNITAWNPAASRLFGYNSSEAIGQPINELIAKAESVQMEAQANMRQAMQGKMLHTITQRTHKDGHLIDIELYAVPTLLEGKQTGTLAIYHDITELQRARQEAEAATQAKSAFLATMSHEIRTPMNAVIGMTGLLLDTPLTPEQREFAETIRQSGDALLTIINDILDFSKIEAGRMELESQPFDLRECLDSAIDLLAPQATKKGLNLACVVNPDVPTAIVGDVTRLRQVLVNLLGNAVKFTPTGEVVLTVQAQVQQQPQPLIGNTSSAPATYQLHLSIHDTGIGIPHERVDRLFKSFSQVDISTSRRFGGTGLGLVISKRLVELMGGTMWAESEGVPGKGSTFHFTILAQDAPALSTHAYLRQVQPGLAGKRVLIVDDNPTNRRIVSLQTQAWGMIPHETGTPHEALGWVRRGDPFNIAFLDVQMPEMDGIALANEIHQLRGSTQLPLVMLSSLGKREAQADSGPWAAYLIKPIKASQLYNVLVGIFGAEAGLAPATRPEIKPQFNQEMGQQHPLHILLAEDNPVNQKLAIRLLGRMGYRADIAANGIEVLESLKRQSYDVILMDVQMPEMDGLEASRRIWREWPAEKRPRIIAMTANAMQEDREECLAAGMDDFISKPIRVEELVAALYHSQALNTATPCTQVSEPVAPAPAPTATPTPVTDTSATQLNPAAIKRLREMAGDDEGFLKEMIGTFLTDAPGLVSQIRTSLEHGDAPTLRRAAHSLKSNSADFGAQALSDMCRELEMKGKAGTLDGAQTLVAAVEQEFERVKLALQALQQSA
jgi:PAS domain S-box-containing protein